MMKLLTSIVLILLTTVTFGADVHWTSRVEGSSISSAVLSMEDDEYTNLSSSNFVDVRAFSYLRLGLNNRLAMDYENIQNSQIISVMLDVLSYDNLGNQLPMISITLNIDLRISGDGIINTPVLNLSDYRMDDIHKFEASVTGILIDGVPVTLALKNYVYLEAGFFAERYYQMDEITPPSLTATMIWYDVNGNIQSNCIQNTFVNVFTCPETEEFLINWSYVSGAEYYDLEWTWVDNYSDLNVNTPLSASSIDFNTFDFERNSTRIRTSDQFFRIPHVFSKGFLIFRVRGVGRWLTDTEKDLYGRWSSGNSSEVTINDWLHKITVDHPHEGQKNWQYQATYAEEGKKKEVNQYFDGSLRGRQTVTRINSDDNSIVGETIYDTQGRGVVQILPVPQDNPALKFYPLVNLDGSSSPYSHLGFDWETSNASCDPSLALPLNNTSGAAQYYSTNGHLNDENWQKNVPESNGYPFTQIEYTPDNTGRIRNQSGVGIDHQIGSGHETKYYYLQPSQEELNRLFGYKVGYMSRYKKNLVVDANGQVSISYLDAQGRVIATSLAGSNNTDFESLNSESDNTYHNLISTDLLNKALPSSEDTPLDNNELYSTGTFGSLEDGLRFDTQLGVIDDASLYNFYYEISTDIYQESCSSPINYPYVYDLRLSLKDDCGNEIFIQNYNSIVGIEQIGSTVTDYLESSQSTVLDQGSYTLSKELTVNEVALANYMEHYVSDLNECILDSAYFVDDSVLLCKNSCDDCVADLGTLCDFLNQAAYDLNYISVKNTLLCPPYSNGYLPFPEFNDFVIEHTSLYHQLKDDCLEPCRPTLSCDSYKAMMMADLMPNGQYGITATNGTGPLSVFTSTTPELSGNWRSASVQYYDNNGAPALIEAFAPLSGTNIDYTLSDPDPNDQAGPVLISPKLLLRADFISIFQYSWAESLLPFHPEFLFYQYSEDLCTQQATGLSWGSSIPRSSAYFDAVLRDQINSVAQAQSNVYGIDFSTTTPIYSQDPYFKIPYSAHFIDGMDRTQLKKDIMEAALLNYKASGLSMLQYAIKTAVFGNNYNSNVNTTISTTITLADVAADYPLDKDQIWQVYKSYYLSYKEQVNQYFMDLVGFEAGLIFNGCIGSGGLNFGIAPAFNSNPQFGAMISLSWSVISANFSLQNLVDGLCTTQFNDKEIRIVRIDNLYNSSSPESATIAEATIHTDFIQWQQTGLCPITVDMERLLNKLGVDGLLANQPTTMADVNELVPDLYEAITGTPPQVNSFLNINGIPNGADLDLSFSNNTTNCKITIPQLSPSLPWSSYGGTWSIFSVSSSYVDINFPNKVTVIIRAGVNYATSQEYVVTYTSDCVNIDFSSCLQVYASGSNEDDPDCEKEEEFEEAMLELLQYLALNNEIGNSVVLDNHPQYVNTVLVDYFGNNASWTGSLGRIQSTSGNVVIFNVGSPFSNNNNFVNSFDIVGDKVYVSWIDVTLNFGDYVFSYLVNGVAQDIDFTCPCGPGLLPQLSNLVENLVTDLLNYTGEYEGLQLQSLDDMSDYIGGLHQIDYVNQQADASCVLLEINWKPVTVLPINEELGRVRTPVPNESACLTIRVCNDRGLCEEKDMTGLTIVGVSDIIIFANDQNRFSCTVLLSDGTSCNGVGTFNCYELPCEQCLPYTEVPVSCTNAYAAYKINMLARFDQSYPVIEFNNFFPGEYIGTEEKFCNYSHAYIYAAYEYYLSSLAISTIENVQFLTISEFVATGIGLSNSELMLAVDAYNSSVYSNTSSINYLTWNEYVGEVYLLNYEFCPPIVPVYFPNISVYFPCNQWENTVNNVNGQNQYGIYKEQMLEAFKQAYIEGAISSVVEKFYESHVSKEYHYTLYYYDRAGNLVQTVPPKGVNRLEYLYNVSSQPSIETPIANANGNLGANNTQINSYRLSNPTSTDLIDISVSSDYLAPEHTYETKYNYNSLNQLVSQETPDGGISKFAYDALGRLIMSQNAKQLAKNQYSYTKYDFLGRVVEVGELTLVGYTISELGRLELNGTESVEVNQPSFPDNLSTTREEITRSIYDELVGVTVAVNSTSATNPIFVDASVAYLFGSNYSFSNTRNRIVGVTYQENYEASINVYDNATFYDYDVHGNVSHLIQVNNHFALKELNQHIKHFNYEYDLVSGNVNKVIFQKGEADQYIHRYCYDADNRIIIAETSKDDFIYEKDAKYFYYDHGPLARSEIGEDKVQASDYAYTIQGWLKTVNGEQISENTMLGQDGLASTINSQGARDVNGFSLSYFDDDYQSASTHLANNSSVNPSRMLNYSVGANAQLGLGLYNGNIRSMYTALVDNDENMGNNPALKTHQTSYTYDQLNRIISMMGNYQEVGNYNQVSGYGSTYSYDANGNLQTLTRSVSSGINTPDMDNFSYIYNVGNNQLNQVTDDSALDPNYSSDIDNTQLTDNYVYDEIGQLITDTDEGILNIDWKVTNKVRKIEKEFGAEIVFDYDAMGNRIAKHNRPFSDGVESTFYVLDAQGNPMSTYSYSGNAQLGYELILKERNIYGSSRVGLEKPDQIMSYVSIALPGIDVPATFQGSVGTYFGNEIGDKRYELSNHLGNVLTVVTDRKLPMDESNNGQVDYYTADVVAYNDYYPFGMIMPGRNDSETSYRYGFQGQERDDEVKGNGNSINYKYRMHDPRIGRFFAVDPLAAQYSHNSPYAFSENRVLDGIELEGLEYQNFMTNFKTPGELKIKLPTKGETQYYSTIVQNSKMSFTEFKDDFKTRPHYYLTASSATFNSPVDGEGNPTTFQEGAFIKIDIKGPLNNSYVKVNSITEVEDGAITVQFVTLEGHVEKGIINFTLSQDNDNIKFEIRSNSEVDQGLLKVKAGGVDIEKVSRNEQKSAWISVMKDLSGKLGGTTKEVVVSNTTPEQDKQIKEMIEKSNKKNNEFEWEEAPQ